MVQGVSFIFHHAAVLFVVLAMAAGLFTIGCFGPLIAVHVRDTLHASARLFGIITASVGVGLLIGTQVIRRLTGSIAGDALVLWGLAGIGAGVFLLGAVPVSGAAIAGTLIVGFAIAAIMVPAQTLLQQETPPDMIGRVSSTNISVAFFGQIIGLILSGVLADRLGVRTVFFLCAGLALAMAGGGRMLLHGKR
jgi:DHA3 family macrolide efflux protein-like MFS transporter